MPPKASKVSEQKKGRELKQPKDGSISSVLFPSVIVLFMAIIAAYFSMQAASPPAADGASRPMSKLSVAFAMVTKNGAAELPFTIKNIETAGLHIV